MALRFTLWALDLNLNLNFSSSALKLFGHRSQYRGSGRFDKGFFLNLYWPAFSLRILYSVVLLAHSYKLEKFQNQASGLLSPSRVIGGFIRTTSIHVMER